MILHFYFVRNILYLFLILCLKINMSLNLYLIKKLNILCRYGILLDIGLCQSCTYFKSTSVNRLSICLQNQLFKVKYFFYFYSGFMQANIRPFYNTRVGRHLVVADKTQKLKIFADRSCSLSCVFFVLLTNLIKSNTIK